MKFHGWLPWRQRRRKQTSACTLNRSPASTLSTSECGVGCGVCRDRNAKCPYCCGNAWCEHDAATVWRVIEEMGGWVEEGAT